MLSGAEMFLEFIIFSFYFYLRWKLLKNLNFQFLRAVHQKVTSLLLSVEINVSYKWETQNIFVHWNIKSVRQCVQNNKPSSIYNILLT